MTHLVYFIIYGRVFFDVGIGGGQIGFRLVIVIIRDEIFNGILWKQFLNSPCSWARKASC
jgi:hypothetical protein